MKKQILITSILASIILTGCGKEKIDDKITEYIEMKKVFGVTEKKQIELFAQGNQKYEGVKKEEEAEIFKRLLYNADIDVNEVKRGKSVIYDLIKTKNYKGIENYLKAGLDPALEVEGKDFLRRAMYDLKDAKLVQLITKYGNKIKVPHKITTENESVKQVMRGELLRKDMKIKKQIIKKIALANEDLKQLFEPVENIELVIYFLSDWYKDDYTGAMALLANDSYIRDYTLAIEKFPQLKNTKEALKQSYKLYSTGKLNTNSTDYKLLKRIDIIAPDFLMSLQETKRK